MVVPVGFVVVFDAPVGEVTVGLAEVPVVVVFAVGTGTAVELPASEPVAAGVVAEPVGVTPAKRIISKQFSIANE